MPFDIVTIIPDAEKVENLAAEIQNGVSRESSRIIAIRNVLGFGGSRLSAYEYTNLIKQIGRIWTTQDELAAESRYQLVNFPEIIELSHDGLLGSRQLPPHSDLSHHPSRPYPYRSLYPVVLPTDGSGTTTWYSMYRIIDLIPKSRLNVLRTMIAWHRPAYGTGWEGRWNRLIELDPITGLEWLAWDKLFVTRLADIHTREILEQEYQEEIQAELNEYMDALMTSPGYQYTHHWAPNDLVVWSNRGLVHTRTQIGSGQSRKMWRITFDLV